MKHLVLLGALVCATSVFAQQAPKGWQLVQDHTGKCQMSVPADWKMSGIGAAVAPGGKARVGIHPSLRGDQWPAQKKLQKEAYGKFKAFDATDKRLWYATNPVHKPTPKDPMHWQVTVPDSDNIGFCRATLEFDTPAQESTMKKIAETVHLH